ncbi:7214_t:CDS:1, partial [Racocetra fulgida]
LLNKEEIKEKISLITIKDIDDDFVDNLFRKNHKRKRNDDESREKKQRRKTLKNTKGVIIKKTRPYYMKGAYEHIDANICISEIMKIYRQVVDATDEEFDQLYSLLMSNFLKYPDPSWFTKYSSKIEHNNDFFINSPTITNQHYLDIVYKILIRREEDPKLEEKIGNIFDTIEI